LLLFVKNVAHYPKAGRWGGSVVWGWNRWWAHASRVGSNITCYLQNTQPPASSSSPSVSPCTHQNNFRSCSTRLIAPHPTSIRHLAEAGLIASTAIMTSTLVGGSVLVLAPTGAARGVLGVAEMVAVESGAALQVGRTLYQGMVAVGGPAAVSAACERYNLAVPTPALARTGLCSQHTTQALESTFASQKSSFLAPRETLD
jgi:hypothetical protein